MRLVNAATVALSLAWIVEASDSDIGVEILDKIPAHQVDRGSDEIAHNGSPVATLKTPLNNDENNDESSEDSMPLPPPFRQPIPKRQDPLEMGNVTIPEFVLRHAPVVRLYSEERYYPYDIEQYVTHFDLKTSDKQTIMDEVRIQDLSHYPYNRDIYMTSHDEFIDNPDWITGKNYQPDIESGKIEGAPATLIIADDHAGNVDAFWFYFYSFNEGPYIMGTGPYGNHIGDWEHSLVRFKDGVPQIVWMSAHGGGSAYKYRAMEKLEGDPDRPVIFSARGTHANYASVGQHSHDLPFYILSDFTDRGPMWDPAKNYLAYGFDKTNDKLSIANGSIAGREERLGNWLSFTGHWGDERLSVTDPRQRRHPFEWRFIDGPTGPVDKNLNRYQVCQRSKWWNILHSCRIRYHVDQGEGIEAEGGNCLRIMDNIHPLFLQYVFRLFTWRGWGVFLYR